MDFKRLNNNILLHAVVGFCILIVAIGVRIYFLEKSYDAGTANLILISVIICGAVLYLIILSLLGNSIFPATFKKIPTSEESPSEHNDINTEKIKLDAKQAQIKKFDNEIALFQRYARIEMCHYLSDDELSKLDKYIECYARMQPLPENWTKLRAKELSNLDIFHFGWNIYNHFRVTDQEKVSIWLRDIFANLSDLEISYIKGKLKTSERSTYKIPIIEDISIFMTGKEE